MAYSIRLPDGTLVENIPDEVTPEAAKAKILQSRPELSVGTNPAPAPMSLRDTGLSLFEGATGAVKGVASAFGADNAVAQELGNIQKHWGTLKTPERRAEIARRAQLEEQAAKSGSTTEELAAFLGGVKEAPLQSAVSGVGSTIPAVIAGIAAAAAGAPAAIAAGVGVAARFLMGAVQGAGEVKGSIYDAVEEELLRKGVPPDEAKRQAQGAQEYMGKNWGTIAAGAGLGGVAAGTGAETAVTKALTKQAAKKVAEKEATEGFTKRALKEAGKEALPEGAQGGQEQYAQNVALTREGIQTPAMQGVIGSAARDAAVGALTGAAVSPFGRGAQKPPAPTPETPPPAAEAPPAPTEAPLPTTYAELVKERAALEQMEQTDEVKARIALLADAARDMDRTSVEAQRQAEAQAQADARKAKRSAFAATTPQQMEMGEVLRAPKPAAPETDLFGNPVVREEPVAEEEEAATPKELEDAGQMRLPLRRTPEGQPTTTPQPEEKVFTAEDIMLTAIPLPKGTQVWVQNNVWGRTPTQLASLIDRDPKLVQGSSPRAQLLRTLTAPAVPAFEEAPRVRPARPKNAAPAKAQPATEPGGGEPSLGVPSEPARVEPAEPGAAPAAPAGQPSATDGFGLVPTEQPAGEGRATEEQQPGALTEPPAPAPAPVPAAPRNAYDIATDIRRLEDERRGLLTKAGRVPAPRSKARARWDELSKQIDDLHGEWMEADAAERKAKRDEEEAKRKEEAADMKRRLDEQNAEKRRRQEEEARRKREAEARAEEERKREEEKRKREAEASTPKELPERLREPIGTSDFGMEEGQYEVRRGPQGMLFPMTKKEEIAYAKQKEAVPEEEEAPAAAEKDERQLELAPRKEEPEIADWAKKFNDAVFTAVYADDEVGLFRAHSAANGQYVYVGGVKPVRPGGYLNFNLGDIESFENRSKMFTDEQLERLLKARQDAVFAESKRFAKYPQGPFTGATSNVAKTDSIDQKYADYLHDLMQSLGLGDVRIFLTSREDLHAPNAKEKYHLYKDYASAIELGLSNREDGSIRVYGPDRKSFAMSIRPGMSEALTLEVIAHELGHAIEMIAFDTAPEATQNAIALEFNAWLKQNKGLSGDEFIHMLRNRETAAWQKTADMSNPYWTSFSEWFADNVSRWATTSEKPLTITEKFFSKVAQMMRDLVAVVTGRKYPPNAQVAKFLDAMGPNSAAAWLSNVASATTVAKPSEAAMQSTANPLLVQQAQGLVPQKGTVVANIQKAVTSITTKTPGVSMALKVRTSAADKLATVEHRLAGNYDKGIRDNMGNISPVVIARQAQDVDKFMPAFYEEGGLRVDPQTKLMEVYKRKDAPNQIFPIIHKMATNLGMDFEQTFAYASTVLEGMRLSELVKTNASGATDITIHWRTPNGAVDMQKINAAVAAYNSDPDMKELSRIMDSVRVEMVNQLEATGRLTPEDAKVWRDVSHYVPFDRIEDFSKAFSGNKKITTRGLASLGKLPELKGSEARPVGNVFENYFKTLAWMGTQLAKQNANTQMMAAMQAAGYASPVASAAVSRTGYTVPMYVNGELKHYDVRSEWDQVAFLDKNGPAPKYVQFLSRFTGVVRTAVTANPVFAAKQVVMDIQGALLFSGVKNPYSFIVGSLRNFGQLSWNETMNIYRALRGEATITHNIETKMRELGLSGAVDYTKMNPAMEELFRQGVRKRTKFGSTTLGAIIHGLEQITHASDLAVRAALYDDTIQATQDKVLASYKARELINFRRQGSGQWAQHLVSMVPFLNASAQANDLIYRTLTGKSDASGLPKQAARAQFAKNAAIYAGFALTYAMLRSGDDDYEKMERRTRDNNWVLPGNVAIPIRGDLAILKVAIENGIDWNRRQQSPEELEATEAIKTVLTYAWDQTLGRVATPVPVALRPWLENITNFSFLTQRAMEGTYQRTKPAHLREMANTTETSKAIAEIAHELTGVSISPNHIDNVLRSYLGTTAATVTMVTDAMIYPDKPDRPLHKMVAVGAFAWDESQLTQGKTEFYQLREKVMPLLAAYNDMLLTDSDKATAFAEKYENELLVASVVQNTLSELARIREYQKWLKGSESAREMTKTEREEAIKEMDQYADEVVQYVRELRHELKI